MTERGHPNVPLPRVLHQVADVPADARVLIVGDVHGCLAELQDLLVAARFRAESDVLVLVGDLVNKGPSSVEVLRFLRSTPHALAVRGNHDDAALAHFYIFQSTGQVSPKYAYVEQFSPEDVAFLEQLPFTISLPHHNALAVHAGIVPGVPLDQQKPIDMYKMRFLQRQGDGWIALEKAKDAVEGGPEPKQWAPLFPGPVHVYFGHAAGAGLQQEEHATGLDTGCVYGRRLTGCILPTKELVHVQAHRVYEEPSNK